MNKGNPAAGRIVRAFGDYCGDNGRLDSHKRLSSIGTTECLVYILTITMTANIFWLVVCTIFFEIFCWIPECGNLFSSFYLVMAKLQMTPKGIQLSCQTPQQPLRNNLCMYVRCQSWPAFNSFELPFKLSIQINFVFLFFIAKIKLS